MILHPLDHAYVVLLALILPVVDYFLLRAKARRIHAGETELRGKLYRNIILQGWLAALVLLVTWFGLGRSPGDLGLVPSFGRMAWVGYGLAVVFCALLVWQLRSLRRNPEGLRKTRETIGWLSFLMPHDRRELRGFDRVSITAGVCEELLFRGFLVAYLMSLFGSPFWVAGIVSSAIFGLAHSYQGPRGFLKTGIVGGALVLLYGMTGSLWAPMVVHAVTDLTSGRIALAALRPTGEGSGSRGRPAAVLTAEG